MVETIKCALKVITVHGLVKVYRTYGTFAVVLKGLRAAEESLTPGLEDSMREVVTTIL